MTSERTTSTTSEGVSKLPSIDAVWATIAVLLPVAAALMRTNQALDLAYHVAAGDWMIQHRALLDVDIFTYTVPGAPWLNQQWGAQLILAAVGRVGGWPALDVFRGVCVGISVFLVYRSCRAVGAAPRTASLLTIAGGFVSLEILASLRPQQLACVLFALTLWCVATRGAHPNRVWAIPLIVVVWANVHGTFPLALVILAFAVVEDRASPSRRRLVAVLIASAVATLVNPYGASVWTYIVELSRHPIVISRIAEWQTPSARTGTGLIFYLSVGAVVVFLARRPSVPWLAVAQILVYAGLSVIALRGVVWWGLAVPIVIASLLRDDDPVREPSRSPLNVVMIAVLGALVVLAFGVHRGTDPATGSPKMLTYAPDALVAALREEVPPGANVFTSQVHAPWAELRAPEFRYTVDSRIELFPEDVWDEYIAISEGRAGWQELLDARDVDALLLQPDQATGLLAAVAEDPGWRLVAENVDGALYVRT